MISDRHHECLECRSFVRKHHPASAIGQGKAKYIEGLRTNESKYEDHIDGLRRKAVPSDVGAPAPKVRKTRTKADAVVVDEEEEQVLSKATGRRFEAKECVGILWPVPEWEKAHEKKAPKSMVSTITINGEPASGIVRPRAEGIPPGGKELWETNYIDMANSGTLHRKSEGVSEKEHEDVCKFGMSRMKVKATLAEEKDCGEYLKLAGGTKSKAADLDELDDLWAGPEIKCGAAGGSGSCALHSQIQTSTLGWTPSALRSGRPPAKS